MIPAPKHSNVEAQRRQLAFIMRCDKGFHKFQDPCWGAPQKNTYPECVGVCAGWLPGEAVSELRPTGWQVVQGRGRERSVSGRDS